MSNKTPDPHDRLLAKAFGDLDTRPFAWCFNFDEDQPIYDGTLFGEVETEESPAAPQEPREGVTYYMTGDNFLAHLRRSLGMPEE